MFGVHTTSLSRISSRPDAREREHLGDGQHVHWECTREAELVVGRASPIAGDDAGVIAVAVAVERRVPW